METSKRNRIITGVFVLVILVLSICFVPRPNLYGAATTINGNVITEQAVTEFVDNTRKFYNLEDDAAWSDYLKQNNQTPATIRFSAIQSLENVLVTELVAKERGVNVSNEEVDEELNSQINEVMGGQDKFNEYLEQNNSTESEFRKNIYLTLLTNKIKDTFTDEVKEFVTEAAVITDINQKYKAEQSLYHYYLLTWSADNQELQSMAESVHDGDMSFEEFAKKLDITMDAANQGWVLDAEAGIDIGGVFHSVPVNTPSEIIEGYNNMSGVNAIVMWDDMYVHADGHQTKEDLANDSLYSFVENKLLETYKNDAYKVFYQNYYDSADIQIYAMPSGLSYDVE